MYKRIVISMAACFYMQAVHLNVLRVQQINRKDTVQVTVAPLTIAVIEPLIRHWQKLPVLFRTTARDI